MKKVNVLKTRMKQISTGLLIAVIGFGLVACSSSKSSYTTATNQEEMTSESYDMAVSPDQDFAGNDQGVFVAEGKVMESPTAEPTGDGAITPSDLQFRKLIKTVDFNVETEGFDDLMTVVKDKITQLDGYIESISTDSNRYQINRFSSITARIPSDRLEEFVNQVKESSNVTYHYEYVQDVTLTYVDLESHKKVLQTEQATLIRLLESAENIEDIITIESRLSDVRYQIESMESQLRTYDNLIAYSTVHLSIAEVEREKIIAKTDALSEMKTGFLNSYYNIIDGMKDFGVDFVINLPYIIIWVVFLGIGITIALLVWKKQTKKQERRENHIQESKVEAKKETEKE